MDSGKRCCTKDNTVERNGIVMSVECPALIVVTTPLWVEWLPAAGSYEFLSVCTTCWLLFSALYNLSTLGNKREINACSSSGSGSGINGGGSSSSSSSRSRLTDKDWVEPYEFTFVIDCIWCSKGWHFFKNEPAASVIRPASKWGLLSLVDWAILEDIAQMYALEVRRGNKTTCYEECVKVTHGFGIEVW
jgi:hypothetical protein